MPVLYWARSCLTYVFNAETFFRMPRGEPFVRQVFATSYQTWADVGCGTTPAAPFRVEQAAGTTTTSTTEFLYDQPNEAIVVLRTGEEWSRLPDHDSNALALTLLWHDKKTGEILDVDMELNGGSGTFTDCAVDACTVASNMKVDLQNTVTHEAGHLLGLGHSTARGSTMEASTTRSGEQEKRNLEPDDEAGYCSLELPTGPCPTCACEPAPVFPSRRSVSNCSCSSVSAASTPAARWIALGTGVVALGLIGRRHRRRQRQ
ncbi:MAG: matrixin family metalloprotease [Polyangiales bacterium]